MPSSKPTDPGEERPGDAALEHRIAERIRGFDVTALLALLEEIGYPPESVRRAGFPAPSPQPAWLDSIAFHHRRRHGHPHDRVTVSANLGLSSCRTPLPAYFRRFAEDPEAFEPLSELLELLDDRLLERRFLAYAPERDPRVFPSPAAVPAATAPGAGFHEARRDLLTLTALCSPSALHWLFAKVYPELRVTVRRAPQDRWVDTPDARLGSAELGVAALSGLARLPVRGMEVTLLGDHRVSRQQGPRGERPWVEVARERLGALIFPVLGETGLSLTVTLLLLDARGWAHVDRDQEGLPSWVGYDPLRPAEPAAGEAAPVLLFSGPVPAQS
jgi:hypothetical protein